MSSLSSIDFGGGTSFSDYKAAGEEAGDDNLLTRSEWRGGGRQAYTPPN